MKRTAGYLLFSLLLALILNGCAFNNNVTKDSNEDIFQYKGTVIGNNSAIINILGKLKHNEKFEEASLVTSEKPYGMTVTYGSLDTPEVEKEYKETAITNATFLFALIKNAKWITFHFDDQAYKITRSKLQDFHSNDLNEFASQKELEAAVEKQLSDDSKVNQFFAQ
ncbi:DUF4825 domain-containing protein [Virgibacillus halodenitrificans]|uniref:DUF4825 domain-containing protein n=1 Tax=Virgibacillus halodenitrificans TaxID=1482 RepID=UPI0002DBC147|nr:DUF4825 domain-containing protein [Virgibacillus halodenitrificans]MEC2160756.1 DUF4825 domain-containing protein [Virgibacillus halodenitrificans]CDQ32675.1 hypothetical protein BN993_02096 [Virgibacillus halodenitrificans]